MDGKYIVIALIFFMMGFIAGEQFIKYQELDWCVKTGLYFLHEKGIDIEINSAALTMAISHYKGNINRLIASNFSSSGG